MCSEHHTPVTPICIPARPKWTDTGFEVRAGHVYRFEAEGTWTDSTIQTGPDGFPSNAGHLRRSTRMIMRMAEPLRRARNANWFALMGALDQDKATIFLIGGGIKEPWLAPRHGKLYCFANDVSWMRCNNKGAVQLTISEVKGMDTSST